MQLESWLIADKVGDKRLRAGLPPNWGIGDKTGSGDHGTANTIAILRPPKRAPLIAAVYYTEGPEAMDARNAVHKQVGGDYCLDVLTTTTSRLPATAARVHRLRQRRERKDVRPDRPEVQKTRANTIDEPPVSVGRIHELAENLPAVQHDLCVGDRQVHGHAAHQRSRPPRLRLSSAARVERGSAAPPIMSKAMCAPFPAASRITLASTSTSPRGATGATRGPAALATSAERRGVTPGGDDARGPHRNAEQDGGRAECPGRAVDHQSLAG